MVDIIMLGWHSPTGTLSLSTTTPATAAVVVERKVDWNGLRRRLIGCCG